MKKFVDSIAAFVSRVYNLVPGDLKIIFYPAFLTMIVSYLLLVSEDIKEIMLSAGRYQLPALVFSLAILGGIAGYLIKKGANQGEKVLVKEGDEKTIDKLETQVKKTEKVLTSKPD